MNEQYENGPFGYVGFSDDGLITHTNLTACNKLKYDKLQLIGKPVESIFTLPTKIFYQTHLYPLVKLQGHADEIFISLLDSSGEYVPVLLNANLFTEGNDQIIAFAFIVVQQRKKFEDELVAARQAAEKALTENIDLLLAKKDIEQHASILDRQMQLVKKQNEELQQFHHVITHNLKEPLRKVLLFGSIAKEEISSEPLNNMLRSAEQLKAVVLALQQYVWLNEKSNEFANVDLNDVVKHAQEKLANEGYNEHINIAYDKLPSIEADLQQLQLLFYHLLHNAIQFRKETIVHVTINAIIAKRNVFRHVEGKYLYTDSVKIEVTDDGKGFDPIYRKDIFGLFRKLQRSGGQGVGLALCKRIAENHHGDIESDSRENSYTKIILWLPVKQ